MLSNLAYKQRCPKTSKLLNCPLMTRAELLKGVVGKHALLVLPHDKIDEELVNAAGDQLKVIGTHSVG